MQNSRSPKRLQVFFIRGISNTFGLLLSLATVNMGMSYLLGKSIYSLSIIQTIQTLYSFELLNSLFKITDQNFFASLMQIGSRVFISSAVCTYKNRSITSVMFVVWGISDTLRFIYYILPGVKKIRYLSSFFLYPLGVFCEVYLMVYKRNILSVIGFLVYIPGFFYLYSRIKRRVYA